MPLNLIRDAWIPVRTVDGARVIRPGQIAEPDVLYPDWPRADLNIACLEFLIGLVYMAMPPKDADGWDEHAIRGPNPALFREKLAPLAEAFNLGGDGPRFLQDFDALDGDPSPPDMLFIDSAGTQTAKNNADLMVWRARYPQVSAPLAAMALYTLQAHAPSGGAGNRTSMRGGGPLVTLVQPALSGLWPLVWANVPDGKPQGIETLPWMRPTRTSETESRATYPPKMKACPAEAFFGMPRRLRLVFDGDAISGVVQRPWGTNYKGWVHPLTPYYRMKAGSELLPKHPRAEAFGYRNWLGTIVDAADGELAQRAQTLKVYSQRVRSKAGASVIVAGWSMDNMKPVDFILSHQPLLNLSPDQLDMVQAMVEAAERFASALRMSLKVIIGEGARTDALREDFFIRTHDRFVALVAKPGPNTARFWLAEMRKVALNIFDAEAMGGLDQRDFKKMKVIVEARSALLLNFAGAFKFGREAYAKLGLALPESNKKGKSHV